MKTNGTTGHKGHSSMRRIIENTLLPLYEQVKTRFRPGVSSAQQALTLIPERLLAFSDEIMTDSSQVESDFLRLGQELQKTHEDASTLVRFAHDTVVIVNGEGDEGLLNQVDRVVHNALTELRACRNKVCQDAGSFATGAALMGDLYALCRVIDQMVLELGMVGLNIGVESARSHEALDLFGLVASDVRDLSKKIAGIAENIRNSTLDARDMQLKAHREITSDIEKMTVVAGEAEKTVQEAVRDIKNLMAMSTTAMNEISDHSREISKYIGSIVAEVQFHDNMHQRIMHITEALEELARFPIDRADRYAGRAHAIIDLQSAQLRQVIREVDGAYRKTIGAFDEIARHVGELARSISCFHSEAGQDISLLSGDEERTSTFPADGADAEQLFSGLHDAIERFKKLLEQGYRLHGKMQETFDHASSSATQLSDAAAQVRKINFEIHLLSLNAIVKASHMGSEGMALEVLAYAVKGLSDQSNGFVSRMGGLLNDITATARTGKHPREEVGGIDVCINSAFMNDGGADIMKTYERMNRVSMDIVTGSEALIHTISITREGLSFLSDLKDRLDRHLRELESCKRTVSPFAGKKEAIAAHDIDRLKTRYTMIQERIVHGYQTTETNAFHPLEIDAAASKADDGVELFDTNITNFTTTKPPEASDGLGDNVELF